VKKGFTWDGLDVHAEEIIMERNPVSPVCGKGKTKTARRKKE